MDGGWDGGGRAGRFPRALADGVGFSGDSAAVGEGPPGGEEARGEVGAAGSAGEAIGEEEEAVADWRDREERAAAMADSASRMRLRRERIWEARSGVARASITAGWAGGCWVESAAS